jgi:hypothetical protein
VIAPLPDTPAERAGIKSGDQVIALDGRSTEGWKNDQAVKELRGQPGSAVELRVRRVGVDQALTATDDQRANQVLPDAYAANRNIRQWLNPAAFAQPALGTYGNMNPGTVRAPGFFGIDTSVTRRFNLTERQSFELRGEAFNILNHVNPGQPVGTFSSSTFGQIQSANDPRILQIAVKYVF